MSTPAFVQKIEDDLRIGTTWLEHEFAHDAVAVWQFVKPFLVKSEPVVMSALLQAAVGFLTGALGPRGQIGDTPASTLEADFLNHLEGLGGTLLGDAQALGSAMIQSVIALAQNAVPPAPVDVPAPAAPVAAPAPSLTLVKDDPASE